MSRRNPNEHYDQWNAKNNKQKNKRWGKREQIFRKYLIQLSGSIIEPMMPTVVLHWQAPSIMQKQYLINIARSHRIKIPKKLRPTKQWIKNLLPLGEQNGNETTSQ